MVNYFFLTLLLGVGAREVVVMVFEINTYVEALTVANSEGFAAFRLLSIHPGFRIQRIIDRA